MDVGGMNSLLGYGGTSNGQRDGVRWVGVYTWRNVGVFCRGVVVFVMTRDYGVNDCTYDRGRFYPQLTTNLSGRYSGVVVGRREDWGW